MIQTVIFSSNWRRLLVVLSCISTDLSRRMRMRVLTLRCSIRWENELSNTATLRHCPLFHVQRHMRRVAEWRAENISPFETIFHTMQEEGGGGGLTGLVTHGALGELVNSGFGRKFGKKSNRDETKLSIGSWENFGFFLGPPSRSAAPASCHLNWSRPQTNADVWVLRDSGRVGVSDCTLRFLEALLMSHVTLLNTYLEWSLCQL